MSRKTLICLKDLVNNLEEYGEMYISECMHNTKEVVSSSGKVVNVRDRYIPTIDYFLNIWLPRNIGNTIAKKTYYEWMRGKDDVKSSIIKNIDDMFKALAIDIVANEGRGIFYAKNRLGMSERYQSEQSLTVTGLPITINTNVPPLALDSNDA